MKSILFCLTILLALLGQPAVWAATQLTDAMSRADFPDYRLGTAGNLHLVWYDATINGGAIFYKMTGTSDAVLIDDTQVNAVGTPGTRPVMAIDASNRLFVAWQSLVNQEIYFVRLEPLLDDRDGSVADPAIKPLPEQSVSNGQAGRNPAMAIDANGDLHVVWERGVGGAVQHVLVDPDTGLSPNGPVSLGTNNGSGNDLPDIAIDSAGHVHVVYTQPGVLTPANEVYYTMFDVDAVTGAVTVLIAPTLLTGDDGMPAGNATLSVDLVDNRVYVVYSQTTATGELVYLSALDPALDDQNANAADPDVIRLYETPVTGTPAQFSWRVFSRIGLDRRVHAIYMDYDAAGCANQNFTSTDYTIHNTHVTYDGKLITTETLTSTGAALGCNPQARLAPRANRVVWTDSRTGDLEIFSALFSRADAGSSGFFACSLGRADTTLWQAGELWLLLAFLLVLWRLRARRTG